jgi:hypothetical protein
MALIGHDHRASELALLAGQRHGEKRRAGKRDEQHQPGKEQRVTPMAASVARSAGVHPSFLRGARDNHEAGGA